MLGETAHEVKSWILGEKNLWRRKHRDLITCLDIRFKTVVLETNLCTWAQVNFARYFVLELMAFHIHASFYDEEFLAPQRRKLQLENKASRGARFSFYNW